MKNYVSVVELDLKVDASFKFCNEKCVFGKVFMIPRPGLNPYFPGLR